MIGLDKIEEWVREVEERPGSAPNILRYIGRRLKDLSKRNEELLAENILLRSGGKVEEYENRIANLEYQLDLLKRQFNGDSLGEFAPQKDLYSIIIYTPQGKMLRVELDPQELASGMTASSFDKPGLHLDHSVRLLAASSQEELLFVFDSGRTVNMAVSSVPMNGKYLDWEKSFIEEPRPGEELVAVVPIARMSLYSFCLQASRLGFVKKIPENLFENHVSSHYIGTGVRIKTDKTCSLAFGEKDDLYILVSREGWLLGVEVDRLPFTIEEIFRLNQGDYIMDSFMLRQEPSLLAVTQNGKVIHRDASWIEALESLKNRGQSLYSKQRREAGVQIAGAAMVSDENWCAMLSSDGKLNLYNVEDLFSAGAVPIKEEGVEILDIAVI
jgi:DNA gyrase/topoisomerase IV subunit A